MHTTYKITLALCFCLTALSQSACSPVDSTKVFAQQQAALLLHQGRTSLPTRQMIKLALPNKQQWQRIDLSYGTVGSPIMLVPANQSVDDNQESIRTQIRAYAYDKNASIEKFFEHDLAHAKSQCARVNTDHLSIEKRTLTYQLTLHHCRDGKNQFQIGKAFTGDDAIYIVYYSAVDGTVSEQRLRQMANVIRTAQLVAQN